jgi:uncharacterized protein DUF3108
MQDVGRTRLTATSTALLLAALACASLTAAPQTKRPKPRAKPAASAVSAPSSAAVPFQAGETLEYRVLYSKYSVNAAKVEIAVLEQRSFFGHPAWHFRATAHTMDTMRLLFPLDDQFDSYTSAANLFSLQYEMYVREQGKEQKSAYRMTGDKDPAPPDVTALRVLPGTRDAIGFLYALRAADWKRAPDLKVPVFDGHHLYDAVAHLDTPQGNVSVQAGNFAASGIAIRLFEHGKELTNTHFTLWLANDASRTPVLVEAEIPFGTSRIELTHLP